jgi:FtsH-binding integral membrane protein
MPSQRARERARFIRAIRLVAGLALAIAATAAWLVASATGALHIHMLVATFLGVFLTVLLAGGLMLLIFASNHSGHDDAVADFSPEDR